MGPFDAARLQRAAALGGKTLEQVRAYARGWLRFTLATLAPARDGGGGGGGDGGGGGGGGVSVGLTTVEPDAAAAAAAAAAVGDECLRPQFWRGALPAEACAEEAALWTVLLQDAKFERALRRAALPALGKLVWLRALADCAAPVKAADDSSAGPQPARGGATAAADDDGAHVAAPAAEAGCNGEAGCDGEAAGPAPLRLPAELEKMLGGVYTAGGSLPAPWWGAAHDRALLAHTAAHGLALSEQEWEPLAKTAPFAPPPAPARPKADAADAAGGGTPADAAGAHSDDDDFVLPGAAKVPAPVGLKQVLLRREKLLKRLQVLLYGAPSKAGPAKRSKPQAAAAAAAAAAAPGQGKIHSSFFGGGAASAASSAAAKGAATKAAKKAEASAAAAAAALEAEEAAEEAAEIAEAQRRARELAAAKLLCPAGQAAAYAEDMEQLQQEAARAAAVPAAAAAAVPAAVTHSAYGKGDKVEMWRGGAWHPAWVENVNSDDGTFDLVCGDGDEDRVAAPNPIPIPIPITSPSPSPSPSPNPNHGTNRQCRCA